MRKLLPILLTLLFISCNKDQSGNPNAGLLKEIKSDGAPYSSFVYDNGVLIKENSYLQMCNSPIDEYSYTYTNGKLTRLSSTIRSIYSSTMTMCNPSSGSRMDEDYEYDTQGRLIKTTRPTAYSTYSYNSKGQVDKVTIYGIPGPANISETYTYDARGNIIEVHGFYGTVVKYDYDNKKNPFKAIKQDPGMIGPYNISPNNVIKIYGPNGVETRKITQYWNDYPKTVVEYGVEYTYNYY